MMVNLGKTCVLVGQVREPLHGLFRSQAPVAHPLQHLENGLWGHDLDPAGSCALTGRVRQAVSAACMTVFSETSKAAAARRQSSNSGAAFHSSPCQEPVLIWITPNSVSTGVVSRARMTRFSS